VRRWNEAVIGLGFSCARLVAGAAWASAPRFCGLNISWGQGLAQAPSFSPIGEMVSGGQSAQFMVHKHGGYAEREGHRERMRETALAALQAVVAEPPRVSPRRLRRCLSRTLKIGTAIAPVPKKIYYEPQNRGAVAQAAPATSRAQDDLRLLRFHNGFWLQNDWSATDARRVGDRKLTRLRARRGLATFPAWATEPATPSFGACVAARLVEERYVAEFES